MEYEFLQFLRQTINDIESLVNVGVEELEEGENTIIKLAPSTPVSEYFDRGKTIDLNIQILSKALRNTKAIKNINDIINHFTKLQTYPQPTGFQWISANYGNTASQVTRQKDGMSIYTGLLVCKINF